MEIHIIRTIRFCLHLCVHKLTRLKLQEKVQPKNAIVLILCIFNYEDKMLTFLYARKNGRKQLKIYTVYFCLKSGFDRKHHLTLSVLKKSRIDNNVYLKDYISTVVDLRSRGIDHFPRRVDAFTNSKAFFSNLQIEKLTLT